MSAQIDLSLMDPPALSEPESLCAGASVLRGFALETMPLLGRVPLRHGDVVVWGGPARLHHHGVSPLKAGVRGATDAARLNLTFRRAG